MLSYIARRVLFMVPTLIIISIISFVIINLPPGDYVDMYVARLQSQGETLDDAAIAALETRYGLGQPFYVQYWKWVSGFFEGDFGRSFEWNRPVTEVVGERLMLTVVISLFTLGFVYLVAIPIGIFAAVRQYSLWDYGLTMIGFLGLSIPNFSLALILLYVGFHYFGLSVGGLFSPEFETAAWSWGKIVDLLQHLWVPVVVVGTAGTAGLIRIMRANLLDELSKQYVTTARAKGVPKRRLLFRYPVRVAINPVISTAGFLLPQIVSGATITAVVLNLPTTGPVYLRALMSQDMYVAGSFVMLLSTLTVIGVLLSDIVLAWADPRIRFSGRER